MFVKVHAMERLRSNRRMKLINYSLKVKKELLSNVNVTFSEGKISHMLGKNGTGKSCFAKSVMGVFSYKGSIQTDARNIVVIGSYSNIPLEMKVKDMIQIVNAKYDRKIVSVLEQKLQIHKIPCNNRLKNLSDGQRQKVKLLFYLASEPEVIILDEFTNALDKESCMDIYGFLNEYLLENKKSVIINITHNLADLEYMTGDYYLIDNKDIQHISKKEDIIERYIKGV